MLQLIETSKHHRRANQVNEALLVTALEQHERAETARFSAEVMGETIVKREQELDRTKDELRLLAAQLLQAQEDERRRIARELHDSFSQQLASLGIQMFHLEQEVSSGAGHTLVAKMQGQLEGLANEVRTLSHQLHPRALEDFGLVVSLRALLQEVENTHSIPIRFLTQESVVRVPLQTATTLYRIAQESLWNIIKHAGEDVLVTVQLRQALNELTLCVGDTGTGFNPEQTRVKGGLGLISMQERARLVSGVLTIESAPGQGTKVRVRIPLGHVLESREQAS
ncbi:MAG: sensor histidine kinase [Janthinobacterium lividum]